MDTESQLKFASLLHDIGKLGYRAGEKGPHEEIGRIFIDQYSDILPKVSSLISMHHDPDKTDFFNKEGYLDLKKLIIADWLASSERIGIEKREDVKKIGLSPIFSKLSIYNNSSTSHRTFSYLGKKLGLKKKFEEIFPLIKEEISESIGDNFKENWESFKKKFDNIKNYKENNEKIFEFLFSLLKEHFKFIPSAAYKVEPDISLFDHSKMVCAFTLALHNFFKFNSNSIKESEAINTLNQLGQLLKDLYFKGEEYINEIKSEDLKSKLYEEKKFFSIIHGDFSGIQNFIHLISSKRAMKSLKGRSFFISLLTDTIAKYITQKLQLTEANIIFAGGGHFFIISHLSDDIKSQIKEVSIKVNKLFIKHFNSNIYLALDYHPLSVEDIIFNVSNLWKNVIIKTSIKKKKKFNDILETEGKFFSQIFGPVENSANEIQRCIICNSFTELEKIDLETDDLWCSQCKSFMELTDQLKKNKFIRIVQSSNESFNKILNNFENAVQFTDSFEGIQNFWYSINSPLEENTIGDKLLSIAFPLDEKENIIDNDNLAKQASERTGFNKIGVLKMDVDSLGKIISRGLGENNTISRISTLSTSLSLFFKGYVSKLVQSEFSDSVYLIFSGGDDLFAVGSWDKIIEFAYKLYKDFRRFTAFNPDITISAGIILESPKFPIIKASLAAEEELENAKNFESVKVNINNKNRIALFGSVLKWDWTLEKEEKYREICQTHKSFEIYQRIKILEIMKANKDDQIYDKIYTWINNKTEFELAITLKEILVYLIKEKDFSKSMLNKIQNSIKGFKKILEDSIEKKINIPKLWRLKYYLKTVLRSRDSELKMLSKFLIQMINIIIKNNLFKQDSSLRIKNVEFISVAVKWADYLTRNLEK